jgi:prepilin-type N-terminal cleavage/methylation domain-containing protein
MKKQKGFSLIELLIVVAIILIIAAIAIPNFLRSKMAGNEASAVSSLRTINTAEVAYFSTYPNQGYSANLASLGGVAPCAVASTAAACLVDNVLAAASVAPGKTGYYFTYTAAGGGIVTTYTVSGLPVTPGSSGQRGFFTDQTGVLRYAITGAATVASSPL